MSKQQIDTRILEIIKAALREYVEEVEGTTLTCKTKKTYIRHAETFVRWMAGDFTPGERV